MNLRKARRIVQFLALPVVYAGMFGPVMTHIVWPHIHCYACPWSVGICPVGAMQNFIKSGRFPFYVVGWLGAYATVFGRAVCGWVCPFGLLNDLMAPAARLEARTVARRRFGALKTALTVFFGFFAASAALMDMRLAVAVAIPALFSIWLIRRPELFKYLFLGVTVAFALALSETVFCKACAVASLEASLPYLGMDLAGRSSVAVDALSAPYLIHVGVLVVALVGVLWARRFWCRYICPLGAILGLFNRFSGLGLRRDPEKCVKGCGLACLKSCPMGVEELPKKEVIDSTDCIRCGDCVAACPNDALRLSFFADRFRKGGDKDVRLDHSTESDLS